mmetsp:Transcript_32939/g.60268  ORF Transcript_32939/g.60268 Transcript_32939/m.60268 type:complete len:214 (+) Transcript_32939:1806-2447(+)
MVSNLLHAGLREYSQCKAHSLQRGAHQARPRCELELLNDSVDNLPTGAFQHGHLVFDLQAALGLLTLKRPAIVFNAAFLKPCLHEYLVEHIIRTEHIRQSKDNQGLSMWCVHCVPPSQSNLCSMLPCCSTQTLARSKASHSIHRTPWVGISHQQGRKLQSRRTSDSHLQLVVLTVVRLLVIRPVLNLPKNTAVGGKDGIQIVQEIQGDQVRGH